MVCKWRVAMLAKVLTLCKHFKKNTTMYVSVKRQLILRVNFSQMFADIDTGSVATT